MRSKLTFIQELADAVEYIATNGWTNYTLHHSTDPHYLQIVETIIINMTDKKRWHWWSLVPDYEDNPDSFCQWVVSNHVNFNRQSIPSQFADLYESAASPETTAGVIRKRPPFHINQPDSHKQIITRQIFTSCVECFRRQLNYEAITNPAIGYKSRGYWYQAATSSGLWYYDYFMQQTLNVMFGPQPHDKYPFPNQQTPPWCAENLYAERWLYTPMAPDDFIFSLHSVLLPTGSSFSSIKIKAEGDPNSPTPGDPEILGITFGIQAQNSEWEPTGDIAYATADPIGADWVTLSPAFISGPATAGIYLSIQPTHGNGDYRLYFRNCNTDDTAHLLKLKIYGTAGDSFEWEVGSGDFSFDQFIIPGSP